MQTQIEHRQIGKASIVKLPQHLVMAVAPTVRAALAQLVESGHKHLVLDMRDIRYVDSSGLSVLIALLKNINQHSGAVVLLDPTPDVRALIELTRLHQVFDIYKDVGAALQGLNA